MAGRPARIRLPVRPVPRERPPGHATVKILGLTPIHAVSGVTEILLGCAGYGVSVPTGPRVTSEHMAPFAPGSAIGRSDVVIAWVQCPAEDPTLARLPRYFSMGSQSVKIDVTPTHDPPDSLGASWAFGPRQGASS